MEKKTKKIPIEWEGKKAEVVIRRMTFGENNDLQDAITTTKIVDKKMVMEIKQGKAKTLMLQKCIVSAPFKTDKESIRNLPPDIGEYIWTELDKFNTFDLGKKAS